MSKEKIAYLCVYHIIVIRQSWHNIADQKIERLIVFFKLEQLSRSLRKGVRFNEKTTDDEFYRWYANVTFFRQF